MNSVDKYIQLLNIDYKNFEESKKFAFLNLKTAYELKLEMFKHAVKNFDEILQLNECDSEFIPYFLRSAFLLGKTDEASEFINKLQISMEEYQKTNEYVELYKIYNAAQRNVDTTEQLKLLLKNTLNKEIQSIVYYLMSLNTEDRYLKEKHLENAYSAFNDNYSIIKYALKNGLLKDVLKKDDYMKFDLNDIKFYEFRAEGKNFHGELCIIGGGNSIGGSCYLLKLEDINILIDCGVNFGKNDEIIMPDFNDLEKFNLKDINDIDLALITHAHLDHCGGLVEFYKNAFSVPIYASRETCELMPSMLKGMYRSSEGNFEVQCCVENLNEVEFNKSYQFNLKNKELKITFIPGGHILGASMIKVEIDGSSILFTGDFSLDNQKTVEGVRLEQLKDIDVLITESTYGNMEQLKNNRIIQENLLRRTVIDAAEKGKKILIPAFALGRGQEIIKMLSESLEEDGNKFNLYVDGQVKEICGIYSQCTGMKFDNHEVKFIKDNYEKSNKEELVEMIFREGPLCIVASSGMLKDGSASSYYAERIIENENALCILTGYQDERSTGDRLRKHSKSEDKQYIEINRSMYSINCGVEEHYLSAHSSLEDIIKTVLYTEPSKVFLIHGTAVEKEKTKLFSTLENIQDLRLCQTFDGQTFEF